MRSVEQSSPALDAINSGRRPVRRCTMRRGGETAVGRYTLWCLNRVAGWDRNRLARALAVRRLWGSRHDVQLGSRARFDKHADWEASHGAGILMHEDDLCDEYFVPIAVKCIGDPDGFLGRLGGRMTGGGVQLFNQLRSDFAKYFLRPDDGRAGWRRYWEPFRMRDALAHVGMFTSPSGEAPHAGLYEIVATEARARDRQAVLVGYSQGGLVARFLAWMDENLFDPKERAIAGVVLVQSPNHGSPLADTANADNVSAGLLGILVGLAGYPIVGGADPQTREAIDALVIGQAPPGSPTWRFGVGAICAILDAAIRDASPKRPGRYDLLRTARKWLTGLSEEKILTAFDDLDPVGLDEPGTILGRLTAMPLARTFHGAIVGADTSLDDLVLEGRNCFVRWLVRHFVARHWFTTVEESYARIAMDERAAHVPRGELHGRIAALYQTGLEDRIAGIALPPFAHDFIIPSVSQALYALSPVAGDVFLGNKLNARATHISGGDERDRDSDSPLVRKMLADLGDRLP
jgi:hypothetical protein